MRLDAIGVKVCRILQAKVDTHRVRADGAWVNSSDRYAVEAMVTPEEGNPG